MMDGMERPQFTIRETMLATLLAAASLACLATMLVDPTAYLLAVGQVDAGMGFLMGLRVAVGIWFAGAAIGVPFQKAIVGGIVAEVLGLLAAIPIWVALQ